MNKHTMKKLNPALRNNRGYGLMEALIVAVCIAVGIAAIYTFYQKVYATQEAHEESQNVAELTDRIMKAYGPMANFTGLSTSSIINEGVVPSSIGVSGGSIISSFGGNVVVTPQNIDGIAGAGFGITYRDVPKNQCSKLVASVNQLQRFRAITVTALGSGNDNGATVVAEHGRLNEQVMSTACNSASRLNVTFVYQKTDSITGASGLELCVAPSPENRTVACPSGHLGSINETRIATCETPYGLPIWGAWTETSNTCAIICTPAPTSPETQNFPCPTPNHVGAVTKTRVSSCPAPTGSAVWSDWTEIANTCAPACIVPSPELRTSICPAGQVGQISERRVATCPTPTGSPEWGNWTVYENTCQLACSPPTPSTEVQWRQASEACPQGYSGNIFWDYEQERTASCPQSTGSYVWSDWRATGRTRNRDESQCVSLCQPDAPLERWVQASGTCPAGQIGSVSFEARETRTSTCAPGASNPTTSAWQRTGEIRNEVNSCVPSTCNIPADTQRTWTVDGNTCSATIPTAQTLLSGQSLAFSDTSTPVMGEASYSCLSGVLSTTANEGATCRQAQCTIPANTQYEWSVGDLTCYASTPSTPSYLPLLGNFGLTDSTMPVTGTANLFCNSRRELSLRDTTCVGNCGPEPAPDTRIHAGCPAGQYGYWTQTKPYDPAPYPTCWKDGAKLWTPVIPPANTCQACPAPSTSTETTWVNRELSCPQGEMGSITYEEEFEKTTTVSYHCPANTASLPAPITEASGWLPTGRKRNEVNTCQRRCVVPDPTVEQREVQEDQTLQCPAYQTGRIEQERTNIETRTVTYSCPNQTGLPEPHYGNWQLSQLGPWITKFSNCEIPACGTTLESRAKNYLSRYLNLYEQFGNNYQAAYDHWIEIGYAAGLQSCWPAPASCEGEIPKTWNGSYNGCKATIPKETYPHGSNVFLETPSKIRPRGTATYTCRNGEWTGPTTATCNF